MVQMALIFLQFPDRLLGRGWMAREGSVVAEDARGKRAKSLVEGKECPGLYKGRGEWAGCCRRAKKTSNLQREPQRR